MAATFVYKHTLVRLLLALALGSTLAVSLSTAPKSLLDRRAAPDNTVSVTSATSNCIVVPLNAHTNVGDSEYPGGMTVYCTASGRTDASQGLLPDGFWTRPTALDGTGVNGAAYRQITGCINPSSLDRLNPSDKGGQYDSSGGQGGLGNPQGSACSGYNHYVELIEPAANRACIRCCIDPADCPLTSDTAGCPNVIPADYTC